MTRRDAIGAAVYGRFVRHALRMLAVVGLLAACGAPATEIELVEMQNSVVDGVPVGLRTVELRRIWRAGRQIDVELATLLVLDRGANTIVPQKVSEGDELVLGGKPWTVVHVESGTSATSGRVVLRAAP